MADIVSLFVTKLYRATVDGADVRALAAACRAIAAEDGAGKRWSKAHGYQGYTSYASLNDLPKRDPSIGALAKLLDKHAGAFAKALHFDLAGRRLKLDSLWINVLDPGGVHSGHIHPHSALSGTFYVEVPPGASTLKLEDPRHPLMMAAPSRTQDAPEGERTFVYVQPHAGEVLMWESFVRHEVPMNGAKKARVSISFNYS